MCLKASIIKIEQKYTLPGPTPWGSDPEVCSKAWNLHVNGPVHSPNAGVSATLGRNTAEVRKPGACPLEGPEFWIALPARLYWQASQAIRLASSSNLLPFLICSVYLRRKEKEASWWYECFSSPTHEWKRLARTSRNYQPYLSSKRVVKKTVCSSLWTKYSNVFLEMNDEHSPCSKSTTKIKQKLLPHLN